jgi:TatD DNase family protein
MTSLVDTHCHLALLEDRGLLAEGLESAAAAGVEQIVTIGLDVDDSDRNRQLAERYRGVFFTVGWHPHQPSPPDAHQLAALDELLGHPRAVAVGEIGLDTYWRPGYHDTPIDVQRHSLRLMLELAAEHRKPVVIHDRDAHAEILEELTAWSNGGGINGRPLGVLHCFSGDAEFAARAVALGMVCSFAGTVTFPRSEPIQDAARQLDGGALVVETDAPFLAPVPHRGRANLPGYVAATAAAVARLRGSEVAALAEQTTANARHLFSLPDPAAGDGVSTG